jgi:hypothetical protein
MTPPFRLLFVGGEYHRKPAAGRAKLRLADHRKNLSVVIARPQSGRGDPETQQASGAFWIAASAFGLLAMTHSQFFNYLRGEIVG